MDNVAPETRSRIMGAVRSKGNRSTERRFRAHLVQSGIRGWRLQAKELPGRPDFVFDEAHVVVFVDGCFWHGCPTCCRMPSTRQDYWNAKIQGNQRRDVAREEQLRANGWKVLRVWEHEIKKNPQGVIERVQRVLKSN